MIRILLVILLVALSSPCAFGAFPTTGTAQTNYCQVPPYLTQSVKPNINLILDFSGSMQFPAYVSCGSWVGYDSTSKVANCGTYTFNTSSSFRYVSTRDYYGNFKSDTYYKYNSSGYFEENGTTCASNRIGSISSNCLSGNLLNWAVTTRMDVLRKILTGGRVKSSTTDVLESEGARYVFTDEGLRCKFTVTAAGTLTRKLEVQNQSGYTCAIGTFSNYNMDVKTTTPTTDIRGIVHSMYPGLVDLELSVYNTSLNSGATPYTIYRVGKNKAQQNYLDAINSEFAYNGTPTGEALQEAKYYFQQSSSMSTYNKTIVRSAGNYLFDPYYENDGSGTSVPAACRKSFNLLISDGEWSAGYLDPVTPAYDMRTGDMRNITALPGKQNVTTYAVYAFGDGVDGRQAMITTAIFGGFDDNDNNNWPYPFIAKPTSSKTVTYPRSNCNPSGTWNAQCAEWDKDRTGLPYNYFEGDDGAVLQQEITKAVNDILGRVSSGTAASILGNNDNNGAALLQALYYPERQFSSGTKASWLGEIQALWYYIDPLFNSSKINLREDSVQDNVLRLSQDQIVRFDFTGTQVDVNLYADANGDGAADNPTSPTATVTSEDVLALWRAGLSLWSRLPSGTGGRTVYTYNLSGTATSNNLMSFSLANRDLMKSYLDVPGASINSDSDNIINYTLGADLNASGYRNRTVTIGTTSNVWKLGDIINSTPKLLSASKLNTYDNSPSGGYSDSSYGKYVNSRNYRDRGVAFVGANDGMLHAFKLGKSYPGTGGAVLSIKNADGTAATDLGKELWSFVPKNVLPYLKHLGNPSYKHLFYVDSTPMLIDASIGQTKSSTVSCDAGITGSTPYYICPKSTATDSSKNLLFDTTGAVTAPNVLGTSWRTVLLGSMGLGGATRDATASCTDCVKVPAGITGSGYSSYFAMDVTDPEAPQLLWEFSNPSLGFSTVRPAIVRIKDPADTGNPERNGRWYVVLANGPTGPIDTTSMQMKAFSDQPLTLFVLDLKTGTPIRTFSTGASAIISGVGHTQVTGLPANAFGGTFSDATIDTDKGDVNRSGRYSDDALYLGYIRKDTTTGSPSINKFAKGGVVRLLTGDNPDPANWKVSTVVDGIGPVSSAVTKLQDRTNGNLWLYFGTGRYFYKIGSTIDEDFSGQQEAIYGIKEPCYSSGTNDLDNVNCTSSVTASSLVNQTSTVSTVSALQPGWKINLAQAGSGFNATRIITNPVSTSRGILFFTAFKPSTDICSYGGDTSLWAVTYDAGGAPNAALRGQVLIQLSTGAFKQVDLSADLTLSGGRETTSSKGVSSKDEPAVISNANHFPSRKILHIQER
jgi:type IV pilus assembly protein PilY1